MEIHIDRKEMKRRARASMRTHKPGPFWVTLVFALILVVLSGLSMGLQFPGATLTDIARAYMVDTAWGKLMALAVARGFAARLLDTAISFMIMVLSAGYSGFCLNVSRNAPGGFGNIFDPFAIFLKVIWLNIIESFLILLWSFLLVFPGIIAAYRYSMAIFILLDDPEKGVVDCLRESKAMTQGHKGELFVLDLSFIGWLLLSVIPFVDCYTIPYMAVAKANYYQQLSGRFAAPWLEEGAGETDPN